MTFAEILLVVALFVYLMWRRLSGEPLQARRLVVLPAILVIVGVYQLQKYHVTTVDVAVLAAEAVVALGLGLVRGATVKVYERSGHLWYRYRPVTIALWFASLLIRIGMGVGGHLAGSTLNPGASIMLMVGATFLGEAAVVGTRALRTGVPFAPDRRSAARVR